MRWETGAKLLAHKKESKQRAEKKEDANKEIKGGGRQWQGMGV